MSQLLLTEEDVKAKVINEWLRNHGFGPKDISLETGFELRLGTSVHRVGGAKRRGRSDYVVRAADGRNLMVIEAKAADQVLDQGSRDQGISYARLLRTGGIAPFVVITNGRDTEILDAISGETVVGATIPQNHPSVTNGFRVSADDFALRNSALAAFVGLSVENLLEFCRATVATRMQLLRSEDIASGKKYIPVLNVPRRESSRALREFLRSRGSSVVLVTGRPQVGKTNFLCGFVEEELSKGNPCLFYPAVSIRKGLLEELAKDFGWTFNESTPLVHTAEKLQHVCAAAGKTMTVFVDGWNEADREVALALHSECKRLGMRGIRFVISATRVALGKLLIDSKNNCEYIADAVGITRLSDDGLTMRTREETTRCKTHVAELKALHTEVFEHEERYRELLKRQGELVDLLDLSKNQAAAQQSAEAAPDSAADPSSSNSQESVGHLESTIPVVAPKVGQPSQSTSLTRKRKIATEKTRATASSTGAATSRLRIAI